MGKVRTYRFSAVILFLAFLFSFHLAFPQDFSKDIDHYRKLVRENPNNIEALVQLAKYLSWSGRWDESIDIYKEALKKQPGNVDAELGLAAVYSWQKKYSESIRLYKGILAKHPDHIDAMTGLARVYSFQGSHTQSIQIFQKSLKYDSENKESLLGLGRVYSWNKQYVESEKVYRKLLQKYPKDPEVLKGLADTYKWSGQYTKGIDIELKILEMTPKNIDSHISIGYMYGELGAIKQSIHWYEKAAKIDPERGDIQAHLGMLYSHTAQVDAAATAFKKAISLQERDIQSYISLGRVYSWQNKIEESEKLYKKALEINPQSAGAYAGLGQLYFFNGQWRKSIEYYKKSLSIDPSYVESLQGLKRVSLLKAPVYITRYNLFVNNYHSALTNQLTNKEYQHVFSHELTYKFDANKLIEARALLTQYASRDAETGFRDYLYNEKIMSLRLDYPVWKDRLFFSGRYDQELFENAGHPHTYNFRTDEWFSSGYSLLRYEKGPFFSILSFSAEPNVTTRAGGTLNVDHLASYGISSSYDFSEYLSTIATFFFNDYTKGTRDRRDWKGIINYRLPFFKNLELGYEMRFRDHPAELTRSGTFRLQERFLKDKLLVEGLYRLDSVIASENYGMTNKHIFQTFISYPLLDWVILTTDTTFQINKGADPDNFKAFRHYITFLLDWKAVRGGYYKD
ncbi:MAG: hypothetical protein A2Z91_07590 [Deltaproteobacteria bacterium GWA2_38_16]|nr:MAG: hypothetical protein A2Z91_07590 [Deltaproteobacteria bacterium GWA2_38_16]OGQ03093.1 MAG: hypothetical protein A3D19_03480 [Deltaproteobacteria bacterium RIFCSPHIGHO2_02_FULL_38_15]OGQ58948.1 MAG: hypothetical protein A3G92_07275 [Deltaproteobacteria bacterium RIFCSPLOWO2_12_FULL_38_8]HBQ20489.1 hypothetical protein [Deltaproteobacteria bacterium]